MKWLINWIKSLFAKKVKPPVVVPDEKPTPEVIPVSEHSTVHDAELLPSYRCDKFMQHGVHDEDEVREAALDAAQFANLHCIRCDATNMNAEVAVHILHYRSPVDNEFKLGKKNWYNKALTHGVNQWQFVVTPELAPKWISYTKDYPDGSLQFLAKDVAAVKRIITTRPVLAVPE